MKTVGKTHKKRRKMIFYEVEVKKEGGKNKFC